MKKFALFCLSAIAFFACENVGEVKKASKEGAAKPAVEGQKVNGTNGATGATGANGGAK
jgi:hypothetical protein